MAAFHFAIPPGFTPETFQVCQSAVIGMVLGDGSLSSLKKKKQSYLSVANIQEDYVRFKATFIEQLTPCRVFILPNRVWGGVQRWIWRVDSRCHPLFTALRRQFYVSERKTVDRSLLGHLDPIGLAIWYMDDGTFDHRQLHVALATNCFDEAEHQILVRGLWQKFGLRWDVHRRHTKQGKEYLGLGLRAADREKFFDLVTPTVSQVPSMLYKLPTAADQEEIRRGRAVRIAALQEQARAGVIREQHRQGASLKDLAESNDVSAWAIRHILKSYHIRPHKRGRTLWGERIDQRLTEEVLHDLYVTHQQTSISIAKQFGVHPMTVLDRLRRYGIPVRRKGTYPRTKKVVA